MKAETLFGAIICVPGVQNGRYLSPCNGRRIRYFGLGTEGLEKIVKSFFPILVVDRLDSDNTKHKGDFHRIYERMKSGATDILDRYKNDYERLGFLNFNIDGNCDCLIDLEFS